MDAWDNNKPVLEKLGIALFETQALEATLVNLFAGSKDNDETDWLSNLQALFDDRNPNRVLKNLESLFLSLSLPASLMPILHQALIDRNWLLHQFYFEFGRSVYDEGDSTLAVNALDQRIAFISQLVLDLNELLIDRQLASDLENAVMNKRLSRSVDVYLGRRELL